MKLNSSNASKPVAARASFVFFVFFVVAICWIVDGTDAALDLEVTLARGMENALRALLRGLCLPSTLTCSIAPACSGLRIATASALFALYLSTTKNTKSTKRRHANATGRMEEETVCFTSSGQEPLRRGLAAHPLCSLCSLWLLPACIGVLAGLWLNLARLLAIELGMRASPAIGATLHDFALPLLIAPLAAALCATLPRLKLPQRVLLATTSALLLALLLNAPAYIIEWEALP